MTRVRQDIHWSDYPSAPCESTQHWDTDSTVLHTQATGTAHETVQPNQSMELRTRPRGWRIAAGASQTKHPEYLGHPAARKPIPKNAFHTHKRLRVVSARNCAIRCFQCPSTHAGSGAVCSSAHSLLCGAEDVARTTAWFAAASRNFLSAIMDRLGLVVLLRRCDGALGIAIGVNKGGGSLNLFSSCSASRATAPCFS